MLERTLEGKRPSRGVSAFLRSHALEPVRAALLAQGGQLLADCAVLGCGLPLFCCPVSGTIRKSIWRLKRSTRSTRTWMY